MASTKIVALLSASFLLVGCGGLSEDAKRAAKAHADNLCIIAESELWQGSGMTQAIVNGGDIYAFGDSSEDAQVIKLANQMARERGCVK